MESVLLTISKDLNLVATLGPISVGLALELRKIFAGSDSGAGFDVQILGYRNGTLATLDESDQIFKDWMDSHPEQG
jgi:hypothetical protein